MTNLKVLSIAAALVLPVAMSSASFAQSKFGGGGGARVGGGGGGVHVGGGGGGFRGGAAMGGGGFRGGAAVGGGGTMATGAGFRGGAMAGGVRAATPGAGAAFAAGPRTGAAFAGGPRVGGVAVAGGTRYAGGNWNGGNWRGGYRHRHGGFWPGVAAGALVGGAIGSSYAYYGDPYYSSYGYYDDGYYDDSATVAVVPGGGDDAAYCAQRYKSYDPASGTYLGYDGQRHPCP